MTINMKLSLIQNPPFLKKKSLATAGILIDVAPVIKNK